ncbi:MAG: methanogenesis marker 16 metalloprotein [Methanomassiliicoccaceae archaeon]|jgi:putative methanogenesis marker 16 metalloprotein|nr:methanogenesis marker 16 metalloprotein [Methanomassiliicoccaceae archaeon]
MKTIDSIDSLIKGKKAKVYTAAEIKDMVRNGRIPSIDDVDVVTCGTFGIMSGTMAILSFDIAEPGAFAKADSIELNGVPGIPGPCPNENLGIVDCAVYGTSKRDGRYGGGHLFRDMVSGSMIKVDVTSGNKKFARNMTIDDIATARMIVTRGAFRNYTAFLNHDERIYNTIFSVTGMKGPLKEVSVSGCGEINPMQNDISYLREGAPVMVNGGPGVILGPGTRSSVSRPNISASADMKGMDPDMMGGFITSNGPECLTSFAAALPITDEMSLRRIMVLDSEIDLPVAEISTRTAKASASYGNVWEGTSRSITVTAHRCVSCGSCEAQERCPTEALRPAHIDTGRCVACGACASVCPERVFSADLGRIRYDDRAVPITLRQSDRNRAEASCEKLKKMVETGKWGLRCF